MERHSRRSFMKIAGAATGAAALAAAPPIARAAIGDGAQEIDPTTDVARGAASSPTCATRSAAR